MNGTRRDFLRQVAQAGGYRATYLTMQAMGLLGTAALAEPLALETGARHGTKVVVLGAGVAGLATAYELGKAGYDCTVLEALDRVGGRNWTIRGGDKVTELDGSSQTARFSDGLYLNAGPARLAQWMVTVDYARELGVPLEVFTNANAQAYIYNAAAGMTAPVRWRTAKADVFGYVSELLATAADRGALDAKLTAADKERLISFLSGFGEIGNKANGFAYQGGDHRGYSVDPGAGEQPGQELGPVPSLSEVFAGGAGRRFSFELGYEQA